MTTRLDQPLDIEPRDDRGIFALPAVLSEAGGVLWRLLALSRPFFWPMALAALLGFLTVVSNIGLMSTSAWIISMSAVSDSIAVLGIAIVGVRFFGVSRGVFRYLERLVSHGVTFRLLARFRVWFYDRVEPLAPARLNAFRSGDLLSRVVSDIETLQEFYLRVIAPGVVALTTALLMAIFTAIFSPMVTAALLIFYAAAGFGLPWLIARLSEQHGPRIVATRAELNAALVDGVQGISDLLAYGAGERHLAEISALSHRLEGEQIRMARVDGMQEAAGVILAAGAMLTALVIAAPRVEGVLLATVALGVLASFEAILPLGAAVRHLSANTEAAKRLFEIVDAPPAVGGAGQAELPAEPPALTFEGVRFRYGPGEPFALDGVSLRITPGERVAVVGPSGSGKSTLVNLLLRFWEAEEGSVRLGGQDVRQIANLRERVAVVSQHTHLFNASIRENLLLANPHAAEAAIEQAARTAQIHDFIVGLPEGYDTLAGEQGVRLSGGQRQRIAIARALLKGAPLLVLDEPTANLDAVTEREVLAAINMAMADQTVLVITHRPTALEGVDRVIRLEAGRVVA